MLWHDEALLIPGALPANDVASVSFSNLDGARQQGVLIRKIRYALTWQGKTTGGPVYYGVAAGGLTAAEIEEALESDPQGEFDEPAMERSNRRVVPLGLISLDHTAVLGPDPMFMSMRTLKWPWPRIPENVGLSFWVRTGSALGIGMELDMKFVIIGEWERD